MRKVSLAGRLSFAFATRLALRKIPRRPERATLSISFDDIPRTAWTAGGPILRRHGVRATYYLCGDLCGKTLEGREQYRRDDVHEMLAQGHEIGSHLYHHQSTLGLSPAQMRREIALNDAFLGDLSGTQHLPRTVAYPYGEMSIAAKWMCSRRFLASRGVRQGVNDEGADRDHLKILALDNIFAQGTDWREFFATLARERSWAIALAHGVDDTGHDVSCPPTRLEAVIEQALAAGVEVIPVSEATERLLAPQP